MSVLLIDPPEELGAAVVRTLVDDGDEVRVLTQERAGEAYWRDLGAYVAVGDPEDDDLVERAALNVRTIVLLEWDGARAAKTELVAGAARRSGVGRIVVTARKEGRTRQTLDRLGLEYVILAVRRRVIGGSVDAGSVATAVSAADDLAGEPHVVVDLSDPGAWETLRLPVPKT